MNAFTKGNCAKKEFYSQRLAEGATKAFYDPIKKLQLKTFSSLQKTAEVKTSNKTMSLKAVIGHELEKGVEPVNDINESYCYIYDAMAVVQKTSAQRTFGDFALDMFRNVLKVKGLCKRIDIVFDVYREISVKNTERSRRNKTSINVLRKQKLQQAHIGNGQQRKMNTNIHFATSSKK